jgi:hypothetical protein
MSEKASARSRSKRSAQEVHAALGLDQLNIDADAVERCDARCLRQRNRIAEHRAAFAGFTREWNVRGERILVDHIGSDAPA